MILVIQMTYSKVYA